MTVKGINVIGDLTARRGLTEAARFTIQALHEQGIDFSYIEELYAGFPEDQRDNNNGLPPHLTGNLYPINLMFYGLTNFHQLSEQHLHKLTARKYTIAYWVWEFQTIPDSFKAQFERVDEIWTASSVCQQQMLGLTDKPVIVIPHPILSYSPGIVDRAVFGIPEDRFMFLFIFDAAGSVARKNPEAIITAFEQAFGQAGTNGPILVMKARHLDADSAVYKNLAQRIKRVNGILLTDNHSREQTNSLIACSDAYVSLHRAEGFGLTMAEAMAMGKPVIATGYSGNLEFMTPENSYLVDYDMRQVTLEDHADQPNFRTMYEDRMWAEPNILQATELMKFVVGCPDQAVARGLYAAECIQQSYSSEAVGKLAKNRLNAITIDG
jgi:glycosyltransferase involved in cell wall biosynthesis